MMMKTTLLPYEGPALTVYGIESKDVLCFSGNPESMEFEDTLDGDELFE